VADPTKTDKSLQELVSETWDLVVRYARQETIDPLKGLFRFLAYGVAGSLFLALGAVLVGLAIVRALEQEVTPHLSGHWSWVPYGAGALFGLLVAGLLVRVIGAEKRRVERERLALRNERG